MKGYGNPSKNWIQISGSYGGVIEGSVVPMQDLSKLGIHLIKMYCY